MEKEFSPLRKISINLGFIIADKQKAVPEQAFFVPHRDCFLCYAAHIGTPKCDNVY